MLCIAGTVLAWSTFTLAWTHSIEKIRWEEYYAVDVRGQVLRLTEARIRGSGAGMEPPDGARLDEHGVWHYTPRVPPLPVLRITQSPYAAGYELCHEGRCEALNALVPGLADGVVELRACEAPPLRRAD